MQGCWRAARPFTLNLNMPTSQIPQNESERLRVLHALNLLDTLPEPVFDRVTGMAARLLDVPIALVSLVSKDRQWFKAKVGVDMVQVPRNLAFCSRVVASNAPLILADTLADDFSRENHYVLNEPYIRFYAGFPVRSLKGLPLGTLCAIDTRPRTLSADELSMLADLAEVVSNEIRLREATTLARTCLDEAHSTIQGVEQQFHEVFECAGVGIALFDPEGGWLRVNEAFCRMVAYPLGELVARSIVSITHPDDVATDVKLRDGIRSGKTDRYEREKRYVRKDGSVIWVQQTVTGKKNASGSVEYYISVVTNIQARKDAEAKLLALSNSLEAEVAARMQELVRTNTQLLDALAQRVQAEQTIHKREAELEMVIDNAYDAYICMDHQAVVTAWNRQAELTFGWPSREAIGKPVVELIIPEIARESIRRSFKDYLSTGRSEMINRRRELTACHRSGRKIPVEVRIRALQVSGQTIFSAFLHDISERKRLETEREQEARHDSLTGLHNRRSLFESLPLALARVKRTKAGMALLFIDLDEFKEINDTLGHHAGDEFLREIASRLMQHVRQTDMVFRLGGDEFTVLLENLSDPTTDALALAQKLLSVIQAPWECAGHTCRAGASIGIAVSAASDSETADALISRADSAMYAAKQGGKSRVRLAAPAEAAAD